MTIGEYIKKLRDERGWSQRLLSYKTGISDAAISKIETNRTTKPELDTLTSLAKAFGIDREILIKIRDGAPEPTYRIEDMTPINMIPLPLVGTVRAGLPILAVDNIERYVHVDSSYLVKSKEYFVLRITGDSMNLELKEGTLAVIEKTNEIEDGNIAVVAINGDEATIKKVQFAGEGIMLVPMSNNPKYKATFYHMEKDEVHIIGKLRMSMTEY